MNEKKSTGLNSPSGDRQIQCSSCLGYKSPVSSNESKSSNSSIHEEKKKQF